MPSFLHLKNQAREMQQRAADMILAARAGVQESAEELPCGFFPVGPTRLRGGWIALPGELRDVECPTCEVGWTANLDEEVAACWLCGAIESTRLLADQDLAVRNYDRYLDVLEQRSLHRIGWHRRLAMELIGEKVS
jgi:hypothetical protein